MCRLSSLYRREIYFESALCDFVWIVMGKASGQPSKSMIAKDKLCDGDFDKLVIDISHNVNQNSSTDLFPNLGSNESFSSEQTQVDGNPCGSSKTIELNQQPKRPMNAFMVWSQAIRRELHQRFSNVQNALLSKALGRVWRSLDATEKEPYVRKANLIKANHKSVYPNYRYQPRRVQERRSRGNMLIGINLNHPVNQQAPRQTSFGLSQTLGDTSYQSTQVSEDQYQSQLIDNNKQRSVSYKLDHKNFLHCGGEEFETKQEAKQIDSSQTFETYQPYPTMQADSFNSQTHSVIDCRNYRTSIEYNNTNDEFRHQQIVTGSKQASEFICAPCQQFKFSMHQSPYHYQDQQQPLSYEIQQTGYLETGLGTRTINHGSCYVTMDSTPVLSHDARTPEISFRHNQTYRFHQEINNINLS